MSLFTFIMNFRGGTYISQVEAKNVETAKLKWAKNINSEDIQYFGKKAYECLNDEVKNDMAVKIDSTRNVWIFSAFVNGHFTVIHIIKTVK